MSKNNDIIATICEKLRKDTIYEIIVFGSYAQGTADENSDVDIIVVLDRNDIPRSYEEKMQLRLAIRNQIIELSGLIPIDLLVFTKPEYASFLQRNSSFAREIRETGKVLYEKTG